GCSSGGSGLGTEEMMTRSARIGLAAALLLGGATVAMAQGAPATGGYPPAAKNPNLYGFTTRDTRRTTIAHPTMVSATPAHIAGTGVGAVGASLAGTNRPGRDGVEGRLF